MERRLAAILAADVVGYSRLIREDEAGTLAALKAHREELIAPKVAERKGRIVKLMGDGLLAEFPSAVEAVRCAVEIQHMIGDRNADVPEANRVTYRIGINIGDIVVEDDDIYGDGVNLAARLEGLSEPNGICVARNVFNQVKDKLDLTIEHLGEREVKNIAEPVTVYRVVLDAKAAALVTPVVQEATTPVHRRWMVAAAAVLVAAVGGVIWWQPWAPDVEPASLERMAFPLPEKPSIAVLPFVNLSGDPARSYLADGISESLITALSRIPKLFVISRNATFVYKSNPAPPRQVAEELGIRYILDGSVQTSAGQVRVSAQLIDALNGRIMWAQEFEAEGGNVFELQDQIKDNVVTELQVALTQGEMARLRHRQTDEPRAYELFLQGLELYWHFDKVDGLRAKELLEEAVAVDPDFASAHAFLGWMALKRARLGYSDDEAVDRALATALADKALEIDASTVDALTLLAEINIDARKYARAIELYEKAVALSPNHADNLAWYGWRLSFGPVGRTAEGLPLIKKAMRLSPFYPNWYLGGLGNALFSLGRHEEALAAWEERQKRIPDSWFPHVYLAYGYALSGKTEKAKSAVAALLEGNPEFTTVRFAKLWGPSFSNQSETDKAVAALRNAGLPDNPPLPLPDKPSIAVLPFTNMSDDPAQEYFVDGMAEDITTDLSKISGLFVIARNSAFAYKGKGVDVRQIARELGVKYVLEGSVRRAADQVRINAQLIDATTGGHVWAERYDGSLADVFALQDKVTRNIVTALAVNLTAVERERPARKETDSPEAYDAFLRGWAHYKLYTPKEFAKSVPYFEQAIQLDPNYGRAHAALATVYWESWLNDWVKSLGMSFAEVSENARRHLEEAQKDPTPLAHRVAARMHFRAERWDEAIAEAERAIALDANDPDGYVAMSKVFVRVGRPAEGLEFIEMAIRLDPQSDYLQRLGEAQFHLERYDEAAATLLRAARRNPGVALNFFHLAAAYGQLGREQEAESAIETFNKMRAKAGEHLMSLADIGGWRFKDSADRERLREGLRKAGLPEGH